MNEKISAKAVAYHRNGVGGEGFHVVLFNWRDNGTLRHMVATVFDGPGQIAVLDTAETADGNVAFAHGNSWRGDNFEAPVRKAIADDSARLDAEFAAKIARASTLEG